METEIPEIKLYNLSLKHIRKEANHTFSYVFAKPMDLHWSEGAHGHLAHTQFDLKNGKANKEYVRHLSIMTLADEDSITFTTRIPKIRSIYKEGLYSAQIGDIFTFFKLDNKMSLKRDGKPIILISSGVAIATTRPLIRAFSKDQQGITKLTHINIDSSGEYIFKKEIEGYVASTDGFINYYVDSRGAFYKLLDDGSDADAYYYIVGSDEFIITVGKYLISRGADEKAIILDKKQPFYSQLAS